MELFFSEEEIIIRDKFVTSLTLLLFFQQRIRSSADIEIILKMKIAQTRRCQSMGKTIVHNLMSLDGYYAGPNEQVDAIWEFNHPDYKFDRSFHYANIDLIRSSSALLIGKKTFLDKFNVNWKDMVKDPKTPFFMRDLATQIDTIDKIVVSDSLTPENLLSKDNTRIIKREKIFETLADVKQKSDKNIAIIGSRTLWQDLLTHDLIDELQLTVAPVFSGAGTLLFDHQPGVYLKRLDTRVAEGNIMLVFQVSRNKP